MADEEKTYAVPKEAHAREFLANERTFLAWIRTSVAVISFGLAILKFDIWLREIAKRSGAQPDSKLLSPISIGGIMIIIGAMLSVFGAWHYRLANRQIERGEVKANNRLIFVVCGLVVLLSAITIAYLISSGEFF